MTDKEKEDEDTMARFELKEGMYWQFSMIVENLTNIEAAANFAWSKKAKDSGQLYFEGLEPGEVYHLFKLKERKNGETDKEVAEIVRRK